jgi:hypothetical protein
MKLLAETEIKTEHNGIRVNDAISYIKNLAANRLTVGIHRDAGADVVKKANHTEFGGSWVGTDGNFGKKPFGKSGIVPPRPAIRMNLYPDMKKDLHLRYENEVDIEKRSKLTAAASSANHVLDNVGKRGVELQRDKMANGGYFRYGKGLELDPEHNGNKTIKYKGFDDPWIQTGETISKVSYKVTRGANG